MGLSENHGAFYNSPEEVAQMPESLRHGQLKNREVLPDVLKPGLKVVFCGTAVSTKSAEVGAYYAGPGNQFWEVLSRVGLTPRKLHFREFCALPKYGIGLTDLVKARPGRDKAHSSSEFDVVGFCRKMKEHRPEIVAFNGKRAARAFFGRSVDYGGPQRDQRLGEIVAFVLPSTSAAARRYWNQCHWERLVAYRQLAKATPEPR